MDNKTFLHKQKQLREANRRLLAQLCPNGLDPDVLSSSNDDESDDNRLAAEVCREQSGNFLMTQNYSEHKYC